MWKEMETGASGGGSSVYLVTVNHPDVNGATIKTGQEEMSGESLIAPNVTTALTDTHTASSYGGVFDFTLVLTSSISVRLHSTVYTNKFFLVDLIKNGTTIESDHHIDIPNSVTNLGYVYTVSFGVLV